jgi:hypothetical protein
MSLAVVLAGVLALPQLEVAPIPATVGEPVVVRAGRRGPDVPLAGLALRMVQPDGGEIACGETSANGECRFVPTHAGPHVVVGVIDGARVLAPFMVQPATTRWPLALGSIPLGLALLWCCFSRARGRRDP